MLDNSEPSASFQIDSVAPPVPRRRSSIFRSSRPELLSTTFHQHVQKYPADYAKKLLDERIKWQEAIAKQDIIYYKLRNATDNMEINERVEFHFDDYKSYLAKAENFFNQAKVIGELEQMANNYREIMRRELEIRMLEVATKI